LPTQLSLRELYNYTQCRIYLITNNCTKRKNGSLPTARRNVDGKFIRLGFLAKKKFRSRLSFQSITVAAIIITRGQQVSGLQLDK
jgi:hypothetical protein